MKAPPPPPAVAAAAAASETAAATTAVARGTSATATAAAAQTTFEERWEEALGAPDSNEAKDFETIGGGISPVLNKMSEQLACLRDTMPMELGNTGGMEFLDVGSDQKFIWLEKDIRYMVIRPCYESLYQKVLEKWSTRNNRVVVGGNAGTGKSWFQAYVLRRLMQDYGVDHKYLFVIRQVKHSLDLIDLSSATVRKLTIPDDATFGIDLFNGSRVLYFFEPESDRSILPLAVGHSSLATLSEFSERIHEYKKNRFTKLLFPCWIYEHLSAIVENDPSVGLNLEQLASRYTRVGGIIRHVFDTTKNYESEQTARILNADLVILRGITTGIDSDPTAPGGNVSGYILSYHDIPTDGGNCFEESRLDFTSSYVRSEIQKRLNNYSMQEHVAIVIARLNHEEDDRGGLHLQEVVSMLLSKGNELKWQFANVTDAPQTANDVQWFAYRTCAREVSKTYSLSEGLGATDKVLVSTNPNFPLVDIVFSAPPPAALIDSFQVSWQLFHPFTVRALYMLRELHMQIQDTQQLKVFLVMPLKEDVYALRKKQDFLSGSVNADLSYTHKIKVPAARLRLMWQNTSIYVLKPAAPWSDTLRPYVNSSIY